MKLSIIVLNYNTKELTLSCLKSIEKHPFGGKFEVIVVDNKSTDGSASLLKDFKPGKFEFSLIENGSNSGFAKGNNLGVEKAKGEYVLLLNSDTEVTRGALDDMVDFAMKNSDSGVVVPRLLNPDKTIQPSVFRLPTVARAFREYILKNKGILGKYAPDANYPVEVESAVGAAFLITPEARKRVGVLDSRYFMYFEDLDYCRRVRAAGLKVYYLPSVNIFHIHGASGKGSAIQTERLVASSKIYHGELKYYLLTAIIKAGSRLSKSSVALLFVVVGALVLRFLYFPDNIYFAYDQSRDAFMAQEILMGDIKLIGPTASIAGLFHGVFYWYVLAALYFVSQGSVVFAAGAMRVFNVASIVLIYLTGRTLFGKRVGLIAAIIYAFSFENWQEALYFTNPGPAVVTSLLFYYALSKIVRNKDKIADWLMLALGLGLSVQFQFYLAYLVLPLVLAMFCFRKSVWPRLSINKIAIFGMGLLASLSTFFISELKFNARASSAVLGIFDEQGQGLGFWDRISQWRDKIYLTTQDSLGVPVAFVLFVASLILFAKARKKIKEGLLYLSIWIGSTAILYLVVGHNTYYIIGLSAGIVLLFSILINSFEFLKKYQGVIVVGVVLLNFLAVLRQAREGIITQISVQEGMRYGDEKVVVDYIYQGAGDSEVVVSALTMPYDIYPTWAYLFQNYGKKKYGHVPYWVKNGVEGFPGRLPVPTRTICQRYTIYESTRGIEHLEQGFRGEQDLTTELESAVRIGKFTVEKRIDRACL